MIDDGMGIAPDQLPIALRRHTTSKLRTAGELETYTTMLHFAAKGWPRSPPSLESKYFLASATRRSARRLRPMARRSAKARPSPGPSGQALPCSISSKTFRSASIFARQAPDSIRISSWLASFALAYSDRAFTLRHDDKEVWAMPPSENVRERLAMVFGRRASETLLALDSGAASTVDGSLRGFISVPGEDRPDRRMQLLFVNGRLVRNAVLAGAWTSGKHSLLR